MAKNKNAVVTSTPVVAKPVSLVTRLGSLYLAHALDKIGTEPHPNFVRVASKGTLETVAHMRSAVNSVSTDLPPKVRTVKVLKLLADNARSYTQFLKDVLSNVAFIATLEWNRLHRAALPTTEVENAGQNMLGDEEHEWESGDMPLFDQSQALEARAQRERVTEEFRNDPEDILARDEEEIEVALDNLQGWLGLALSPMKPNQLDYWGLTNGIPFGQRKSQSEITGETTYEPLMTFSDYREWSDAEFKKRNKVAVKPDDIDLMLQG